MKAFFYWAPGSSRRIEGAAEKLRFSVLRGLRRRAVPQAEL